MLSSRSISPHGGDERGEAFDRRAVAHVDLERQERIAELVLQSCFSRSPRRPVPITLQPPADELARRGLAEAGGRAGDQDRLHDRSFFELAPRLYEVCGLHAKRLGNGEQVGLMRFEEAKQRGEQRRVARRARSSSVPIPVRSRNRCARRSSPSVAASAARARATGSFGVCARHGLQQL